MLWLELEVVRNAKRFARKYYTAQHLSTRLLQGEKEVELLMMTLQETELFKSNDCLKELLRLSPMKQQQWVRGSFVTDGNVSPQLKRFMDMVVRPAISISASSIPEEMVGAMTRFMAILTGSEATEEDAHKMKLACYCLNGSMDQHPLVQGLESICL